MEECEDRDPSGSDHEIDEVGKAAHHGPSHPAVDPGIAERMRLDSPELLLDRDQELVSETPSALFVPSPGPGEVLFGCGE